MYSVAIVDEAKCIGCRMCAQTCPEPNAIVINIEKKKSFIVSNRCKGCGLCETICPKKAISLKTLVLDGA